MKSHNVTIQMKALCLYFHMELLVFQNFIRWNLEIWSVKGLIEFHLQFFSTIIILGLWLLASLKQGGCFLEVQLYFLFDCFIIFSLASRQFTGSGYVEYNVKSAIYSDDSELKLTFRTVQPSGLLFQSTSSGGDWADYITLEIVGGRLRCVYMYLITHCSR